MAPVEPTGGTAKATTEELQFVEEVALGFERQGLFRMAGRVIGWLLICHPPEQTFGDLVEVLQASKGSISAAMKFLVPSGLVEQISKPGDRRTYYRARPSAWIDLARRQSAFYTDMTKIADRGLRLLQGTSADRRERIQTMHDFYAWLAAEMPAAFDRWEQRKGGDRP